MGARLPELDPRATRLSRLDVFDGLAPDAHGLGLAVEPSLHRLDDRLMLPAGDPAFLGRSAVGLQGAGPAGGQ